MFVVAYGNPFDGISLVGPFDDAEVAAEYAVSYHGDGEWWVKELEGIEDSSFLPDEED